MAKNDVYGEPITIHYPGMTVNVFRPILTDEEKKRRMNEAGRAAASLILSMERRKREPSAVN